MDIDDDLLFLGNDDDDNAIIAAMNKKIEQQNVEVKSVMSSNSPKTTINNGVQACTGVGDVSRRPLPKRPKIDGDDDVIEQGAEYKGPELKDEKSAGMRPQRERLVHKREKASFDWAKYKKPILALCALIVASIVLIICVDIKHKQDEKVQQEHLDDLLSGLDEPDPTDDYNEPDYDVVYTSSQIEELRLAGYTGYEIEDFQYFGYDAQELIDEAAAKRAAKYEEEMAPYRDNTSEEFKELMSKTWLGQPELEVDEDTKSYNYKAVVLNLDYEKIEAKGCQLFLKIYLDEERAIFMQVTPERWLAARDSGNIVVEIKYAEMSNGGMVVTNIKEITN